jgi:hypothetical protein
MQRRREWSQIAGFAVLPPPLSAYYANRKRFGEAGARAGRGKVDTGFPAQSNLCRLRRLICNQIYVDCVDLSAIESTQIAQAYLRIPF